MLTTLAISLSSAVCWEVGLMSLLIEMSRIDIQCLLDHLPQGSDLRELLGKSDATVFSNIRPSWFLKSPSL